MGKLQEFDITFTNNKVVYSPGESISGCLKITCSGSLKYIGKWLSLHICSIRRIIVSLERLTTLRVRHVFVYSRYPYATMLLFLFYQKKALLTSEWLSSKRRETWANWGTTRYLFGWQWLGYIMQLPILLLWGSRVNSCPVMLCFFVVPLEHYILSLPHPVLHLFVVHLIRRLLLQLVSNSRHIVKLFIELSSTSPGFLNEARFNRCETVKGGKELCVK